MVHDDHELMVSTKGGTLIRTQVGQISVIGRNTQGVRVIRLGDDDEVTAIARIEAEVEVEEDDDVEGSQSQEDQPFEPEEPTGDSSDDESEEEATDDES